MADREILGTPSGFVGYVWSRLVFKFGKSIPELKEGLKAEENKYKQERKTICLEPNIHFDYITALVSENKCGDLNWGLEYPIPFPVSLIEGEVDPREFADALRETRVRGFLTKRCVLRSRHDVINLTTSDFQSYKVEIKGECDAKGTKTFSEKESLRLLGIRNRDTLEDAVDKVIFSRVDSRHGEMWRVSKAKLNLK